MMPHWVADYVGIPFVDLGRDRSGCDCWGLVRLVLAERFGVTLPCFSGNYSGTSRRDMVELAAMVDAQRPLVDVVEVDQPQHGDIVLLRLAGHTGHVGLVVAPGWMLHTERDIDAIQERYDGPLWSHRVAGFYRPRALL